MMGGVQPKLPGTLPSPKDARARLIAAKRHVTECRATLAQLREARKVAAEMLTDAEDDRATAAADFEDDDTPGASTRYLRAVEEYRRRLVGLDGAKLAVREAKKTLRAAERQRDSADEDLIAIAAGRRGDA